MQKFGEETTGLNRVLGEEGDEIQKMRAALSQTRLLFRALVRLAPSGDDAVFEPPTSAFGCRTDTDAAGRIRKPNPEPRENR